MITAITEGIILGTLSMITTKILLTDFNNNKDNN